MNRYKKYLQSFGVKLECDYPCMPYECRYDRPALEGVRAFVDLNRKCITLMNFYVVGTGITRYYANGYVENDFD